MTHRMTSTAALVLGLLLSFSSGAAAGAREDGLDRPSLAAPVFEMAAAMCSLELPSRDAAPETSSLDTVCGDATCESPEDCQNCSQDCGCEGPPEQCIYAGAGEYRCEECIQASCFGGESDCFSPCNNTGTVYCWSSRCYNDDWTPCYWNPLCQ